MLLTVFNVFYILVAVAMVALILLQRGAGADAGSGFGSGASATVFGSRGSANFLSRATAVLAALFFLLSLAMGMYLSRGVVQAPSNDLGVMSGVEVPAATEKAPVTPPASDVPQATAPAAAPAPASEIPVAPQPATAPAAAPAPAAGKTDAKADAKADKAKKSN
ncbi:MAG: preprotein translocase subunit SecG [Tahibacter sp.]